MKIIEHDNFSQAYGELVEELMKAPVVGATHEINNCVVIVRKPSLENIVFPYRKHISEKYVNAEMKWYWSGDNSCHTIGQYAKMWLALSDDGETNNSAYGYILQKKYGFNQIEQIIELLKKDPTTRRAVLNISDPAINRITTKDMQCTIAIDFLIRDGKLQETVVMRSNDVYFGFVYDIVYFVSIGQYIAKRLGIELGTYTHHSISMHMYLRDLDNFKNEDPKPFTVDAESIIRDNYEGAEK